MQCVSALHACGPPPVVSDRTTHAQRWPRPRCFWRAGSPSPAPAPSSQRRCVVARIGSAGAVTCESRCLAAGRLRAGRGAADGAADGAGRRPKVRSAVRAPNRVNARVQVHDGHVLVARGARVRRCMRGSRERAQPCLSAHQSATVSLYLDIPAYHERVAAALKASCSRACGVSRRHADGRVVVRFRAKVSTRTAPHTGGQAGGRECERVSTASLARAQACSSLCSATTTRTRCSSAPSSARVPRGNGGLC